MKRLLILLTFAVVSPLSLLADEDDILGEWYTTDKEAIVEISECNQGICGTITWLKEPNDEDGNPRTDENNPDKDKRDKPVIGKKILFGFEYDGDNKWVDGNIYDPKNGKTYSCKMTLNGDKLDVRGYVGFSFLGRTETWTRVDD